jgi:hypothetical protein
MAIFTIKATYSLNTETARNLQWLAKCWGVAKSAALRRVIDERLRQERAGISPAGNSKLETLDWLQRNGLSKAKAAAWKAEIRSTRESSNRHGSAKWKRTTSTRIS